MKRSFLLFILLIFLIVIGYSITNYMSIKYRNIMILVYTLVSITTAISILVGTTKAESKFAWAIFVLFVPVIGFLFYIILGVEYTRFKKFDNINMFDKDIDKITCREKDNIKKIFHQLGNQKDIISLIYNVNHSPVTTNNKTEILTNGDQKFDKLLKELKNAKKFINMEYFIIKEGKVFDQIKKVLIEKAMDNVEIRILYDDFGSVDLNRKTIKELQKLGIKIEPFNEINLRLFRPSVNYRNHRKIVVIDDKVAFTGGINIGDEYIHLDKYYGFWRDTHILIRGSAVRNLNLVFIKDWYHTTKELLLDEKYLEEFPVENKESAIQIVADGPDDQRDIIKNTFFKMINEANERIWIVTPYLILDSVLVSALKVAALSGIDVRIIVPGKHDKGKFLIYKATEAYFSELLKVGVKIYTYNNHFIHSKVLIIDNNVASIGTANFDYRSFDLHFEITVLLYFDEGIKKLIEDYKEDLSNSTIIDWEKWKKRIFFRKWVESFIRVFSSLL